MQLEESTQPKIDAKLLKKINMSKFIWFPLKYSELKNNKEALQYMLKKYNDLYLIDNDLDNRVQYLHAIEDIKYHLNKIIKQPKQLKLF